MLGTTLLICGAVLCIAIAALFGFQVLNFRWSFERDVATLADIITKNSTAALVFKDDTAGNEVVESLRAKPTVLSCSLCWPEGTLFAHYGIGENAKTFAQFPPAGQDRFLGSYLLVTRNVVVKGEVVGALYLRADYRRTLLELLELYGMVIFGIIIVSTGLAAFLSRYLGRNITDPVLELAKTAQLVGEKQDYSVRAAVSNRGDELGRLTNSFNEMLSRIETQDKALSLSQQKMEALVNSIDGIVWERTPDTLRFTFVSRQSEKLLGYPIGAWLEKENFWAEHVEPADAAKAIQTAQDMAKRREPFSQEYRMRAADGRLVWIRESAMVLVEKDKPVAIRGIFLDITRQKLDAEELDKLNRQLIDASRSAGMADVATGVLHNVGNVLNSVSVAATLVAERLQNSKISKLGRAANMLRSQNGHLAEFLTSDPKGKLIPEYLVTVADELAGEQAELVAKMATVGTHVEHIKEIVAMQQSYAKVSGVYEMLPASALVEDALRINATSFDRHHINLVKEFAEDAPAVCVDRHKVLQILINLLRNAKHAVEAVSDNPKRITVRVASSGPDRVSITVTDNGIGIPPENLARIFNHGFTTKKEGHGFGLHSGANAAKEMGGSLTARSEGAGKGAEFTLELVTTHRTRTAAVNGSHS